MYFLEEALFPKGRKPLNNQPAKVKASGTEQSCTAGIAGSKTDVSTPMFRLGAATDSQPQKPSNPTTSGLPCVPTSICSPTLEEDTRKAQVRFQMVSKIDGKRDQGPVSCLSH